MGFRRRIEGLRTLRQHKQRRSYWRPRGEWLEQRAVPSVTSLDLALPLHFNARNEARASHFLSLPQEVDLYAASLQRGDILDVSISAHQAGSGLASLLR